MATLGVGIGVVGVFACLGFGSSLRLETYPSGAPAATAAQERYAVAFGWFFELDEPPRDLEIIAERFCPAVLSMTLGVEQAKAAMAEQQAPAIPIDKLMVTDAKRLPAEIQKFMTSRGVRVMDVGDDPLVRKAREGFTLKPLVNVLKLAAVTHPDWGYAAIQLADWDAFFVRPVDLLTPAAHEGKTTVGPGSTAPTNGGLLAVRPSTQLRDSLGRALEHGFSIRDGWGGNYSQEDLLLAKPYVDKYCTEPLKFYQGCCRAVPRSMWCFGAAQADQGLLFHLMIDGGRKSTCPPFGNDCDRRMPVHQTLSPKPWQMEEVWYQEEHGQLMLPSVDSVESYNSRLTRWWKDVGPWAERGFRDDQTCGAAFVRQHELYGQWQESQQRRSRSGKRRKSKHELPASVQQRKPVMWVHVHKNAGTSMCDMAEDVESVVQKNDGTCNSLDLHDAFFPDGIGMKPQWTTCADRAKLFLDNHFTWGQIEREINPGDYCPDDFMYGITLRDPVSRLESYANWNTLQVNGYKWMEYMSCIRQQNRSACPAVGSWELESRNWGYREWDNYNLRVLGGYDVMNLPPGGVNSSHLAAAIDLLERFDLVFPIENISSQLVVDEMARVLGWSGVTVGHSRHSPHSQVVFTDDQRAEWAHINRFDVQLYTHFARRYW